MPIPISFNCLSAGLFFLSTNTLAGPPPTLTWFKTTQVPAYIQEGKYKNQGIADKIIDMINTRALSDFSINIIRMNHKRFNVEVKKPGNCYIGWKTFPEYRLFSEPAFIMYPQGIIVHQKNQALFGDPGETLSLASLLKNPSLKLGVLDEFAYSPGVVALLSRYRNQAHVYFSQAGKSQIDLRMILRDRVHYTLGWPSQPVVSEKLNDIPNKFVFFNIVEDQRYIYMGVSCSNCDTGKTVIQRVNSLLHNKGVLQDIFSYIEDWVMISKQWKALQEQTVFQRRPHPLVVHMTFPGQPGL